MKKVFLYLDDFNMMTNDIVKNLEYLKHLKSNDPEIRKIIILIRQEKTDLLQPTERKYFIEKCLDFDNTFIIKTTNMEKIFKIIKKIEGQNIQISKIFVNPMDKSYIENGLKGLPIKVHSFKNYENSIQRVIEFIKNNDYQNFVKNVPLAMHDEYEWLREKFQGYFSESAKFTLNRYELITELITLIERD